MAELNRRAHSNTGTGVNASQHRVRAGVPAGGQFAAAALTESPVSLPVLALPMKDMDAQQLAEAIREAMSAAHPGNHDVYRRVDRAIDLAAELHRDQRRANPTITTAGSPHRDGQPYLVHPLRNALRIVRWEQTDADTVIGAVLHDTVEDQPDQLAQRLHLGVELSPEQKRSAALQVISDGFGEQVSRIVAAVSNPIAAPGLSRGQKRDGYVAHVHAAVTDFRVFLVKASDFVDNALGLHHQEPRCGPTGFLAWKYLPLCRVLTEAAAQHQAAGHRNDPDLADKLAGAHNFLSGLARRPGRPDPKPHQPCGTGGTSGSRAII